VVEQVFFYIDFHVFFQVTPQGTEPPSGLFMTPSSEEAIKHPPDWDYSFSDGSQEIFVLCGIKCLYSSLMLLFC